MQPSAMTAPDSVRLADDLGVDLDSEIAAISSLLRDDLLSSAGDRLRDARQLWPHNLKIYLLEGEWYRRSGRSSDAEACFRAAQDVHPNNPWPSVRLLELLLAERRTADACRLFANAIWPSDVPEATRAGLLSRVTTAVADMTARRQFLEGLLKGSPIDRFVHLKLAALYFRLRDRSAAQSEFYRAQSLGSLPIESQLLQVELLLSLARFEDAYTKARQLVDSYPDRADFARRAIQTAHLANRSRDVEALLHHALERWPRDWLMLFRYNRSLCATKTDRALFDRLQEHEPAAMSDHRWLFQFAVACLRQQQTRRTLALLDCCLPDGPVVHMAGPLRAALGTLSVDEWRRARGVRNDIHADVQIVRVTDARATVIVLAGAQGGLGYLPPTHVSALLADHPVHLIHLHDLGNRGFTTGVRAFGSDQASMVAGLKELACDLGGLPVVTMGSSLGGVAATRLAVQMQALAAISFAGPVPLGANSTQEADDPTLGLGTRGAMSTSVNQDDLSLVDMIRRTPATRIFQCYGTGYEPDVQAASFLRDLPNATLFPVAGCADHFVIEHMIANGDFGAVLRRAIQAAPVS
ncbi:MAG: tetratricopeptide repeat protein [Acetobacteraceae bacterium]